MTEARANLADLINRVAYTGEPIALTRRGRVMAAIVSPEDLELLRRLREARIDLTRSELPAEETSGRERRPEPLRTAAEYRPPGFSR